MIPMQKARYRGKAKAWEWTEAKTGTPQLVIDFEVIEGEHIGERLSDLYALTDNTTEWFFRMLRTLGFSGNDLENLTGLDANEVELGVTPEDVQDDKGQAKIDEHTGEVRQRLRVFVNAGGLSTRVQALDAQKKKIVAAKFKGALAAFDAKTRRTSPAPRNNGAADGPPPGHPANAPNDDIPF